MNAFASKKGKTLLPYRKNRDDGVGSGKISTIEREHDEGFDMLGSIADDLLTAFEKKDKGLLKSALEAFCEHIQDLDYIQDNKE